VDREWRLSVGKDAVVLIISILHFKDEKNGKRKCQVGNMKYLIISKNRSIMKKVTGVTLAVMLAAISMGAQASQPTAELRVTGKIIPVSCAVKLGNNGIVDFGTVRSGELSATQFNSLGERTTSLAVNCSAATLVGLSFTDNEAASKVTGILGAGYTEAQNYGLGAGGGKHIGGYSVTLRNLAAEGRSLTPIVRAGNVGSWQSSDGRVAQLPSQYSWRSGSTIAPAAIKDLTGVVAVGAVINRANALDLTSEVNLSGRATLVLNYI